MARIFERTPESERAASYGYVDFLKDIVQKTVAETTRGFKRPLDFSDEEIMQMAFAGLGGGTKIARGLGKGMWKMPVTRPHLASAEEIPKGAMAALEKYRNEGLTYDAYMNLIPDKPEFATHQWTFKGERGSLRGDTVYTKTTSLDEFEKKVASKIREYYGNLSTTWRPK